MYYVGNNKVFVSLTRKFSFSQVQDAMSTRMPSSLRTDGAAILPWYIPNRILATE